MAHSHRTRICGDMMCGQTDYVLSMCYEISCSLNYLSLSYFEKINEIGLFNTIEFLI